MESLALPILSLRRGNCLAQTPRGSMPSPKLILMAPLPSSALVYQRLLAVGRGGDTLRGGGGIFLGDHSGHTGKQHVFQ